MKYVQDLNMRGGYLELNSECPNILGVYHFNTEHHVSVYYIIFFLKLILGIGTYFIFLVNR